MTLMTLSDTELVTVTFCPDFMNKSTGRQTFQQYWSEGDVLLNYIPAEYAGSINKAWVNGYEVPLEEWSIKLIRPGDSIVLLAIPEGVSLLLAIGVPALIALIVGTAINIAIAIGAGLLIRKLTAEPEAPDLGESAVYTFGGIQTTTTNGRPIPILYGFHAIGGHLIHQVPNINQEGVQVVDFLLGVAEGPMLTVGGYNADINDAFEDEINDEIRINGNPANIYPGVSVSIRLGTLAQEVIPGFRDNVVTKEIGIELILNDAVEATSDTAIDAFEVIIDHPRGLYRINSDGKIRARFVRYQVRWRVNGSTLWSDPDTIDLLKNKTSGFLSKFRKDLPVFAQGNQIDVEVTKLTEGGGSSEIDDITWKSLQEIEFSSGINYSHIACARASVTASGSLAGGNINFNILCQGKRVWVWDGVDPDPVNANFTYEYSTNPAWCALDLILNPRYGAGNRFNLCNIDIQSFGDWADYCDELIPDGKGGSGTIKRWELGLVIDREGPFWDTVRQIAAAGRAQVIKVGNIIKVKIERATSVVQLFTMGNIIRETFKLTYGGIGNRPNAIEVQFLNEEKNFEHDVAPWKAEEDIGDEPIRTEFLQLYGVTLKTRAMRAARYMLKVQRLLRQSCEFECGMDALAAEPGDVIAVAHDMPDWSSVSGRILEDAPNNAQVKIDREIVMVAGDTFQISVRTSGTGVDVIQTQRLITMAGTHPPGTLFTINGTWDAGDFPKAKDVYAVGKLVGVETEVRKFRIISTELTKQMTVKVEALEYNEDVFNDDPGVVTDDDPPDGPPDEDTIPPNPTDLVLTEDIVETVGGGTRTDLHISFNKPDWPFPYTVKLFEREIGGAGGSDLYSFLAEVPDSPYIFQGVDKGAVICISAVSVSPSGLHKRAEDGTIACITITGVGTPPEGVQNLAVVQQDEEVVLTWDHISDLDRLKHYEIRRGQDWTNGFILGTTIDNTFRTTEWAVGSETFFVRTVSPGNRLAETPAEVTVTLNDPGGHTGSTTRDEVGLGWPGTKTNVVVDGDGSLILDTGQTSGTYGPVDVDLTTNARRRVGTLIKSRYSDLALTWANSSETWQTITTTWANEHRSWKGTSIQWNSVSAQERDWRGDFYDPQASHLLEFAFSTDGVSFSSFAPHRPATLTFRVYRFRLTLTRQDATDFEKRISVFETTHSTPP